MPSLPQPSTVASPRWVRTIQYGGPDPSTLTAARGEGTVEAGDRSAVFWLLLRGHAVVEAQEGEFALGPRDWIALDRASAPRVRLEADGVLLGLGLGSARKAALLADTQHPVLFPGRGRLARGAAPRALAQWRRASLAAAGRARMTVADGDDALRELFGFVSQVQQRLIESSARCPGHSTARKRQVLARLQRARLSMEGHWGGALRVADLAERSNFSTWYFTKTFHALYGVGPQQFAAQLRLERACRLLETTRLPVTEVSAACGFDNPCSFSRAFRARYGTTASAHRLRHGAAFPIGAPKAPAAIAAELPRVGRGG